MANRVVFVDLGDTHGPLVSADVPTNADGVPFALKGDTSGVISSFATVASALSSFSALTSGQYVLIDGGDNASTGYPNADRGIYKVTGGTAVFGSFTKVLDGHNTANEIGIQDSGNFFTGTDTEAALQEIGTKQVFYKRGDTSLMNITVSGTTSTAADSAIKSLVIDNGSTVDLSGAGSATANGIILNGSYAYQIPIRKSSTRDIINDGANNEVYARLTQSGGNYVLSFYSYVSGVETAFSVPSQAIDVGFVLASMDFMKLPAFAGVVDGTFFGDEAGAVGTIDDTMIVTNSPAFTGLLVGQNTQEAVNNKVDTLGISGASSGAALIKIYDIANQITATDVEGALAELATKTSGKVVTYDTLALAYTGASTVPLQVGAIVVIKGNSGNEADAGIYKITANTGTLAGDYTKVLDITHTAAEVLVSDANSKFVGTTVEAALTELVSGMGMVNNALTYSSTSYVAANDNLVTAVGKLDAALGALAADRIVNKTFVAGETIQANTAGPRLVSIDNSGSPTANRVYLTRASASSTNVEIVGFATGADYSGGSTINSGNGTVMAGVCGGFTSLNIGKTYYADPAVNGAITSIIPTTVGQWIVPVGIAISSTTLLVSVGEANEIVAAAAVQQAAVHFKSTAGAVGGLGETGYVVAVGDMWIDNDASVQNPTKSGTGRYTVYVCKTAWTGAGSALTSTDIGNYFTAIGTQG